MNDAVEALAIGFAITMIFSIPFIFFAYIRYLRYKETIALAERGLLREQESKNGRSTMRWGVMLFFIGLAIFFSLLPLGALVDADMILGPWLLLGCLPMFFGLGLLVIYALTRKDSSPAATTADDPASDPIPPHKQ
ncbi:MAG: DUF6249 domain-containing protein [Candidatus Promineifilaceae bacterium]|nr:DUF6249 domain-containing protein [Candidatus Promineifilaceae bacterium]